MKRIVALLLAVLMMFALVSCGDDGNVRGELSVNNRNNTVSDSAQSQEEAGLEMGSNSNNTYENKFLGIGCKLDSSWTFLSDAEIRQANNITQDMVGDDLASQLESASIIYDMQATKSDSSANIILNIEKLTTLTGAIMSEEEYVEQSVNGIVQGLESAGLTNVKANKITVNFAGSSHAAIEVSGEVSGITVYEKVVCYKKGKYLAAVAFASYIEDTTDEMLSYFYAL